MGNVTVNVIAEESQAMDNIAEIERHFFKQTDLTGRKYAEGWAYRCRHCGAYAFSVETWFECQNRFVPEKLTCSNWACLRETNARWHLEITPLDNFRH
jgi:hypothetical protein